jgi:hypothetical protein
MSRPNPAGRSRWFRRGRAALAAMVLVAAAVAGYLAWGAHERPRRMRAIVTNRTIWGRDFPALLTALPAWHALGEDEIVISQGRVLGGQLATQTEALSRRSEFLRSLPRRLLMLPTIDSLYRGTTAQGIDLSRFRAMLEGGNVEVVANETGHFRLAYRLPNGDVFSPRLTLGTLKAQIGDPDTVTRAVDPSKFEGRSRVVTTYSYADGVKFVTSNYAPIVEGTDQPSIERALLKVARLAALVPQ